MNPGYWKGVAFRLKKREGVDEGVRRIAMEEFTHALQNVGMQAADRDIGIHETRKSLKKLRALVRIFEPFDPDGKAVGSRENRRLRNIAQKLSAVRDATVAIETFAHVCKMRKSAGSRNASSNVRTELLRQKRIAGDSIDAELHGITAALERARDRASVWAAEKSGIRSGLRRIYRRARRALKAGRGRLATPLGHEFRKRVKELWYALRLLDGVWVQTPRLITQLHKLETLLGDDHNLSILLEKLPPATESEWLQGLYAWIAEDRNRLCTKAELLAEKIFASKSGAFLRSLAL